MRKAIVLAGLVFILAAVNWQVAGKERVLREGTPMLLQLAPVDPRSLMQGDYMRLEYAIARESSAGAGALREWPRDGQLVVTLDDDGVAHLVRRHEPGTALAAGERLLRYRRRDGRVRIGTDAFFFQEGLAELYAPARYGEMRVDADGDGLLIGLRDAERRQLPLEKPADAQGALP